MTAENPQPMPQPGDVIQVCRCEEHDWVESVTVEDVMNDYILHTRTKHGDEIYAERGEDGRYPWVETSPPAIWDDPKFVETLRASLQPQVGERKSIELYIVELGFVDVEGTVTAVDSQGTATLALDGIEVCATADYWVALARAYHLNDFENVQGLSLPPGGPQN